VLKGQLQPVALFCDLLPRGVAGHATAAHPQVVLSQGRNALLTLLLVGLEERRGIFAGLPNGTGLPDGIITDLVVARLLVVGLGSSIHPDPTVADLR